MKEAQKFNLSDDEKEAIRVFTKIHGFKELKYNYYLSCDHHIFTGGTNDSNEAEIELPGEIIELEDDKTYTLEDLGIE